MSEHIIKIDVKTIQATVERLTEFWATIDGDKLAQACLKMKDMDLVGPKKEPDNALNK